MTSIARAGPAVARDPQAAGPPAGSVAGGQSAPQSADRSTPRRGERSRASRRRRRRGVAPASCGAACPRTGLCSRRAGLAHELSARYASQRRYRLRVTAALVQRRAGVPLRLCGAARHCFLSPRGLGNVGHLASPIRPPRGEGGKAPAAPVPLLPITPPSPLKGGFAAERGQPPPRKVQGLFPARLRQV